MSNATKSDSPTRLNFFTTCSDEYFDQNGKQLAESFFRHTGNKIEVYSEDEIVDPLVIQRPFSYARELSDFIRKFRNEYAEKIPFMPYTSRMDKWCWKLGALLNRVEDCLQQSITSPQIFLDADSVIISQKFISDVSIFLKPFYGADIGMFVRNNSFLHPETGFLAFTPNERTYKLFLNSFQRIENNDFHRLPSWTDDSIIEYECQRTEVEVVDFCKVYSLSSHHPIYESGLRDSFLHLKGSRKGKFRYWKYVFGRYA